MDNTIHVTPEGAALADMGRHTGNVRKKIETHVTSDLLTQTNRVEDVICSKRSIQYNSTTI